MNWTIKESKFKYNHTPVVRRTAISQTPLGEFKVYEAVSGKVWIIHPFIKRQQFLAGFDRDPFNEILGAPKIPVDSFEVGIARCEAKWEQVKNAVNQI